MDYLSVCITQCVMIRKSLFLNKLLQNEPNLNIKQGVRNRNRDKRIDEVLEHFELAIEIVGCNYAFSSLVDGLGLVLDPALVVGGDVVPSWLELVANSPHEVSLDSPVVDIESTLAETHDIVILKEV